MSTPCQSEAIEFWFDFGSNYSYLSTMRIENLAASLGLSVRWRPFLLGPIFRSLGWDTSPFVLQKEKGAHMWKDMVRQCRKYEITWNKPSHFPRSAVLPLRIALAGAGQPWIGSFCRAVMQRNFVADREIDSVLAMEEVLEELNLPSAAWIAAALTDSNKQALRAQTDEARRRGVFGAPTFFVGEEMFWGNDRLDDALAYAAEVTSR